MFEMNTPDKVIKPPIIARKFGTSSNQIHAIRKVKTGVKYRELVASDAPVREVIHI